MIQGLRERVYCVIVQAVRKIRWTQKPRLVREKIEDLFAVPDVIAAGDYFDSAGEKLLRQTRRDSESRRGIFSIGDAQVDAALREDVCEAVVNNFAAGGTDDVSHK